MFLATCHPFCLQGRHSAHQAPRIRRLDRIQQSSCCLQRQCRPCRATLKASCLIGRREAVASASSAHAFPTVLPSLSRLRTFLSPSGTTHAQMLNSLSVFAVIMLAFVHSTELHVSSATSDSSSFRTTRKQQVCVEFRTPTLKDFLKCRLSDTEKFSHHCAVINWFLSLSRFFLSHPDSFHIVLLASLPSPIAFAPYP